MSELPKDCKGRAYYFDSKIALFVPENASEYGVINKKIPQIDYMVYRIGDEGFKMRLKVKGKKAVEFPCHLGEDGELHFVEGHEITWRLRWDKDEVIHFFYGYPEVQDDIRATFKEDSLHFFYMDGDYYLYRAKPGQKKDISKKASKGILD